MRYYKQIQLDDNMTGRVDLQTQYTRKELSEREQKVAIEQATKRANKSLDAIKQALQQFQSNEITADELRAICQAQKQAYIDSTSSSSISQFEIDLIWNNGVKRIQNTLQK